MNQVTDLKQIVSWLKQLAELCRPGSEPVTKDKLATYATFLRPDFPITAFTTASVAAIAKEHDFFPSLSALNKTLTTWWQSNRPPVVSLLIEGPLTADLDGMEKEHAASWLRNRPYWVKENRLATSLKVLRDKFPKVFRYIIGVDAEVGYIAAQYGWADLPTDDAAGQADNRASWNDPEAIRASVKLVLSSPIHQLALGKMLGKAVAVNAPQHLHNVPPDWHPTEEERISAGLRLEEAA